MIPEHRDLSNYDLNIKSIGKGKFISPLNLSEQYGDKVVNYIKDDERVFSVILKNEYDEFKKQGILLPTFEKAGPRKNLYFEPGETISAIVTCGGLCPGLNAVIRAIVLMNNNRYNNKITYGIKYGYQGFVKKYDHEVLNLTPEDVETIHKSGGTVLGSSRGVQSISEIVDRLVELRVDILYTIGGDGTLRGAHEIYKEITKRNLKISVIGIPKTIDNDIAFIDKSFGTETAFSKACDSVNAAYIEAKGAFNGVGLVNVMGRYSGFIAANTTLATNLVDFTLIPEIPFELDGPKGFFEALKNHLLKYHKSVVLVAEGAGQRLFENEPVRYDASGNKELGNIGTLLKEKMKEYFNNLNIAAKVRYIDPSYIIRSTPPTPNDSIFCLQLAQNAVHAGMCGKTNTVIGYHNGEFIHIPMEIATSKRKVIDPESELWLSVLESTGQPIKMVN
jgi:6-phosphofructokinase 1